MKKVKIVTLVFLLGAFVFLPAHPSFAKQVIGGNNPVGTGEVTLSGIIGEFDHTDPGSENPEIGSRWIDVTIPTSALFYSQEVEGEAYEKIVSPNYTITNRSGVGVRVLVTSLMAPSNMQEIETLKLNDILLYQRNAVKETFADQILFELENHMGNNTGTYNFNGKALPIEGHSSNPYFELIFAFQSEQDWPADEDGMKSEH